MKSVELLHRGRRHAVAVPQDAGCRPHVRRAGRVRGHRCAWTPHVARRRVALLPHHVPPPFRAGVLEPDLSGNRESSGPRFFRDEFFLFFAMDRRRGYINKNERDEEGRRGRISIDSNREGNYD